MTKATKVAAKPRGPEEKKKSFFEAQAESRFDDLMVVYGGEKKGRLLPYMSYDGGYRSEGGDIDLHFTDYLVKVKPADRGFNWVAFFKFLQVRSLRTLTELGGEGGADISVFKKDHETGELFPV